MDIEQKSLTELRWIRILLITICLPVVVIILKALETLFIPLIFAIFISFVFAPMRSWLSKRRLPLWLIMIIMLLVIMIIFVSLGLVIFAAGNSFLQQLPKYQLKMVQQIEYAQTFYEQITAKLDLAFAEIPSFEPAKFLSQESFSITGFVSKTIGIFMNTGSRFFLTMVFLLFVVGGSSKREQRVRQVLTEAENQQTFETLLSIQTQIQKYLTNKTLLSLGAASIAMLLLWIFGIDFVIIAGLFYFALSFIPNIGSILSTLFPMTICLLQYGFGFRLVALIILLIGNELFFGNFLEPKVMGNKLNLSPIMVLISLIFWAYVWGIVGMMIAVPITSSINILLKRMNEKSLISAIISDV
ncbi:MAG: AI-2E family transporter [Candidatus Cloacimonetes bacterium HGW-Cloacimonetes-1]|jgi:predicted PurR-regulated permease PerM|nr:MAG: AI-2E family transporter [Candidatus Cloacimonetes bacterium HGW-Cloacimonetes-1]